MVGWLIFFGIVLMIVTALILSVTVRVCLDSENGEKIKVKYAGITVYTYPPKPKKPKGKKRRKAKKNVIKADAVEIQTDGTVTAVTDGEDDGKKKKKSKKDKAGKEKESLSENFEKIKSLVVSASRPVKRLLSHIRIRGIYADITAAGEDAAKAAMCYGRLNIAVYCALAFLYEFFRVSVKKINIGVDYEADRIKYLMRCTVKLRLSTALSCGIWLLWRLLKGSVSASASAKPENSGKPADSTAA